MKATWESQVIHIIKLWIALFLMRQLATPHKITHLFKLGSFGKIVRNPLTCRGYFNFEMLQEQAQEFTPSSMYALTRAANLAQRANVHTLQRENHDVVVNFHWVYDREAFIEIFNTNFFANRRRTPCALSELKDAKSQALPAL